MTTDVAPAPSRIPLNTLAIPFGLVGYAGTWSSVGVAFHWNGWIAEAFWIIATCALVCTVALHAIRGHRASEALASQLTHPAQGPLAAIVPISVVLLGAHLHLWAPLAGTGLVYGGAVTAAVFAAWLVARWITRPLPIGAIHGGYFLPTVAGGFVVAQALAVVGSFAVATASFAVGVLFWVVIFTIVLARLAFSAPLPDPLVPTLAILVAPPAVAGMAWLAMNGQIIDGVSTALLGATMFMLLIQIALIPTYRRLHFTLGFWSFTFAIASVCSQAIILSGISRYPGWQTVIVVALAGISALIVAIACRSIGAMRTDRRSLRMSGTRT